MNGMVERVPEDAWTNESYQMGYGGWIGRPAGDKPDFLRCCKQVGDGGMGWTYRQCARPRGFGPGGAYCKQHDPVRVAAEKASREGVEHARFARELARHRLESAAPNFLAALREIAAGHSDPCSRAAEAIRGFEDVAETETAMIDEALREEGT